MTRRASLQQAVGRTARRRHDEARRRDLERDAQRTGLDQIKRLAILVAEWIQQRADILAQGHHVEAGERLLPQVVAQVAEHLPLEACEGLWILVVQGAQRRMIAD